MRRRNWLFDAIGRLFGELDSDLAQQRLGRMLHELGGVAQNGREPPYIVRRGIAVVLRAEGADRDRFAELKATILVDAGHRVRVSRNWVNLPDGTQGPNVPGLADAILAASAGPHRYVVSANGTHATCLTDLNVDSATLDALVDAVVALARFDDGLTDTLLGLPDAVALEGHELDPGVSFGADGLVLGVRNGAATIAQLDGFPATPAKVSVRGGEVSGDTLAADTIALLRIAGDGDLLATSKAARFTWTQVVRDRDRLLAGVRALRSLRPAIDPYR